MRNFLSVVVLAASFAVLVPDNNGARAVNAAQMMASPAAATSGHGVVGAPAVAESAAPETGAAGSADVSWLLALGFLGAVMARRLRVD